MEQPPAPHKENKRSGRAGSDQSRTCHKCGKPGHYAKTCKVRDGSRSEGRREAVEKSAKEAVAEADGLRVALADKEKELTDLRLDRAAHEAEEAKRAKEAAEHLKLQSAQGAMAISVSLGSSRLTMWKIFWMLLGALMAKLALDTVISFVMALSVALKMIFWPIHLTTTRVNGARVQPLRRSLTGYLLIVLTIMSVEEVLVRCPFWLFPVVWAGIVLSLTLIRFTCSLMNFPTWCNKAARLRNCPKETWSSLDLELNIVGPNDLRDDSVSSVNVRHLYDGHARYTVYHPHALIRVVWDFVQFGCLFLTMVTGVEFQSSWLLFRRLPIVRDLLRPIDLDVSVSLARQVKIARNTPTAMTLADVSALVERAAANEGYSNVSSFVPHDTVSELRLNTSKYVCALAAQYREELQEAGF
jgi:hypothetical protein